MKKITIYVYHKVYPHHLDEAGKPHEDTAVFMTRAAAAEYAGRFECHWNGKEFVRQFDPKLIQEIEITIRE